MARSFVEASDTYLKCGSAVVTGKPLTMACFFYPTTTVSSQYILISVANSANYYDQYYLAYLPEYPSEGDRSVRWLQRNSSGSDHEWKTGVNVNAWNHAAGRIDASGNMKTFVNGNISTGVSGSYDPASLNQTGIGALVRNAGYDYLCFEGSIAEAAIWDIDLTADEIAVLAAGYSPLFVRPQNLKAYWPLIRQGVTVDNPDLVGGFDMTDYNSPGDAAHCRIRRPTPAQVAAFAGGTNMAIYDNYYRRLRVA